MRIAHIITRFIRGGADQNTLLSCNKQASQGHEVFLIIGCSYHQAMIEMLDHRITLHVEPNLVRNVEIYRDICALVGLARYLQEIKPSIVHTHESKAGILGRFAARMAGHNKIVHGVHIAPFINVSLPQKYLYLALESLAARFTDTFVYVSPDLCNLYAKYKLGENAMHHVIPSGFALNSFKNAHWPNNWRELLGIGPNDSKPPTLLMLAALEPRKRHIELVRAFKRVVSHVPDAIILFGGEGPFRAVIEEEIKSAGLMRNIRMLGFCNNPEEIIALSDICILTSRHEGLPRVIVQYLAGKRPVVATRLPGIEDILIDGQNAIITDPDNIDCTADVIIDLLLSPNKQIELRTGASNSNISQWDAELMCSSLANVYDELFKSA